MTDVVPPVEVISFSEERASCTERPRVARVPPPPHPIRELAAEWRRRYETTFGLGHGMSPRFHPRVEHRVDGAADAIIQDLGLPFRYDPVEHEYRAPITLRVPWSWPGLPMWLSVASLSSRRSALRLTLRSNRRLRYPLRYFHTAHERLATLERQLTALLSCD